MYTLLSYTLLFLFLLTLVFNFVCIDSAGEFPSDAIPEIKSDTDFFLHPNQDGGFVPAFLEGGPPIVDKDIEEVAFVFSHINNQPAGKKILVGDIAGIKAAGYDPGSNLMIICHGFTSSAEAGPAPVIKNEIMKANMTVNVIAIDWSRLAAAPNYARAASATKFVGMKACTLIKFLVNEGLAKTSATQFVGHSLGAHVGGFLGKCLAQDAKLGKLGRITGLDPACPLFCGKNKNERLAPADALFVDAIHTNGGIVGYKDPIGDADFYPNGGISQPGCSRLTESGSACHHTRSYELYAESIGRPQSFFSRLCSTWDEYTKGRCTRNAFSNMGQNTASQARGTFYLKTNSESPYSQ